jgi:hypothetical protein
LLSFSGGTRRLSRYYNNLFGFGGLIRLAGTVRAVPSMTRTFGYGVVELVLVLFLTITRIYWKFSQTVKSDFFDNLG